MKEIYNAEGKEELVEALDNYIDSIKTLPRDWNPKAYIEPPGGESEHEKGLQIPEEEVKWKNILSCNDSDFPGARRRPA